MPLQVGITGGIGSGKSLVSKVFNCLGIPVYDADSRAKNIMTTDGILMSQIKKEFGALSYSADGSLNRSYLSQTVFNDAIKLDTLNKLVHPRVKLDYDTWAQAQCCPYLLKEAALLFESGSYSGLDKIIVVYAPVDLRIERVLKRDPQRTKTQIKSIMQNQLDEKEKMNRADFVIVNDELKMVIPQVLEIHTSLSVLHK